VSLCAGPRLIEIAHQLEEEEEEEEEGLLLLLTKHELDW